MTMPDGPDEPGMPPLIWREIGIPNLLEARLIVGVGNGVYVGYVARSPGDDEWRGYIGLTHVLVGMGQRQVVQAAVERVAREAWAARQTRGRVTPRRSDT